MAPRVGGCRGSLFCLHHAGGGGTAFRNWPSLLGSDVRVGTVVLPGRESLFGQPPIDDFGTAVERICTDLEPYTDEPYALFGHSLGAILAFEAACRLERSTRRPPSCLIVSGRGALHLEGDDDDDGRSSELPNDEFIDLLKKMGGMAPQVLNSPEMLELLLPVVRADFRLVETYRWDEQVRTAAPILALGGQSDQYTTLDDLLQWRAQTTGTVSARLFEGGHFFVATRESETCNAIADFLARHW